MMHTYAYQYRDDVLRYIPEKHLQKIEQAYLQVVEKDVYRGTKFVGRNSLYINHKVNNKEVLNGSFRGFLQGYIYRCTTISDSIVIREGIY